MRAIFFLIISALCHSLFYGWAMRAFPLLRTRKKLVLGILGVLVVLVPVGRIIIYRVDSAAARVITAFAMVELLIVLMALIPMGVVRLIGVLIAGAGTRRARGDQPAKAARASDAPAPTSASASTPTPRPTTQQDLTRREVFERVAGLAVVGASASSIGWGAIKGRLDFQIEEVVVKIPGLPRALEGYTIAQVSDLHVGLFVDERELRQGLDFVRRAKPDLIVATGDLVDFDERYIGLMARSLGDLSSVARDGVAAILGNHDYYTDGPDVRDGLLRAGVRALVNEHTVLRRGDGGGFVLGGTDDFAGARFGAEGPNLARTFAGAPDAPRILLAHQPQYFAESQGHVALQLSGHVHGGQINPVIHPVRYVLPYVAGRYDAKGSIMWVNRGFGTAGPPARLGSPPEITRIVLVAG